MLTLLAGGPRMAGDVFRRYRGSEPCLVHAPRMVSPEVWGPNDGTPPYGFVANAVWEHTPLTPDGLCSACPRVAPPIVRVVLEQSCLPAGLGPERLPPEWAVYVGGRRWGAPTLREAITALRATRQMWREFGR